MNASQRIEIIEAGPRRAPPVLFIHGFPFDAQMWRPFIGGLQDSFRCIAYHLPGFGGRQPNPITVSLELWVDELVDLIRRHRLQSVTLCGHDLGGYIALRAIDRAPDRIAGLALCNALPHAPNRVEAIVWAQHIRKIVRQGSTSFINDFFPTCFSQATMKGQKRTWRQWLKEAGSIDVAGLVGGAMAALTRTDTLSTLQGFGKPVMLVAGEDDAITPASAYLRVSLGVEGAHSIRVPYAGHAAPLEQPEFILQPLLRFLQSIYGQ